MFEHDTIIYREMMTHPALFSHSKPETIGIIGDKNNFLLEEILKHTKPISVWQIQSEASANSLNDTRIVFEKNFPDKPDFFDIIIVASDCDFNQLFKMLRSEGILLHKSHSPFQMNELKNMHQELHNAGFRDVQTLNFPLSNGWQTACLAKKNGLLKRAMEKDIFNKTFNTHYYNFDMHKASFAMPEFMRHELTEEIK